MHRSRSRVSFSCQSARRLVKPPPPAQLLCYAAACLSAPIIADGVLRVSRSTRTPISDVRCGRYTHLYRQTSLNFLHATLFAMTPGCSLSMPACIVLCSVDVHCTLYYLRYTASEKNWTDTNLAITVSNVKWFLVNLPSLRSGMVYILTRRNIFHQILTVSSS